MLFAWISSGLMIVNAQIQQNMRLEIKLGHREKEYQVIPVQTYGALLHRKIEHRQPYLEAMRIDTALTTVWQRLIPLDKKIFLVQTTQCENYEYLLFFHSEFKSIHFFIYRIDLLDGSYQKDTVYNIIPFFPAEFKATQHGLLVGGYLKNLVPVVVFYDFATKKTSILPGLFNEPGELQQIHVYPDQSFHILISTEPRSRIKNMWLKYYDANASIRKNVILQTDPQFTLLNGRALKTPTESVIISGTYGYRSTEYSSGLFIARIDINGHQEIFFYPFYQLRNFFTYLKPRQEQRLRQRIQRKAEKGKRSRLQYRLMVHELLALNDQFILLGEAYYPVYKRDDRFNYGLAVSAYVPFIFDGYRYTHAVVIGFDRNGILKWDNSFEINDVKTFTLEQFVKMDYQKNRIALLYLFDNRIRSKFIQNEQVIEGKTYNSIKLSFEAEKPENDFDIKKLEHWYPGTFLAYGVQRPESRVMAPSRERYFFINKVAYH